MLETKLRKVCIQILKNKVVTAKVAELTSPVVVSGLEEAAS